MSGPTLRPAVAGDAPFLTSVLARLGEIPLPSWRTAGEVAAADLRPMLAALHRGDDNSLILVAENDHDDQVGCLFVTTETDFFTGLPGAHIEVVVVTPAAEGQGIARRLLEAGETWARGRDYGYVTLNVFVNNSRARAVYENLGYSAETVRYRKAL